MSSNDPQSLSSLLRAAESKQSELEAIPSATSSSYPPLLQETIQLYRQCQERVSALSLFSPNESFEEDLSTSSIPYLSLGFHLGELTQRTPGLTPGERKRVLGGSRREYERFLGLMDDYGLVSPPHDKLLERYREESDSSVGFQVISPSGDAQKRRDAKIQNYRMEKEMRERLEVLKRDPRYQLSEEGDGGGGGADDEVLREVLVADLKYKIHQTFAALEGLGLEEGMLAMAPTSSSQDPSSAANGRGDHREEMRRARITGADGSRGGVVEEADDSRLDTPFSRSGRGLGRGGPLLSQQGKPLQPFTLVGGRQELASGVFRPGHNLPTMSIDEYLEEERRRGGILEGGTEQAKAQVDEDDMENVDRETYKAREWDEYVDQNPKGSGNTLNMG